MSRWLQNVGTFLEKLDDRAEQVVEQQLLDQDDEDELGGDQLGSPIDSILAARGLQEEDGVEEEVSFEEEEGFFADGVAPLAPVDSPEDDNAAPGATPPPGPDKAVVDDSWNDEAFEPISAENTPTDDAVTMAVPAEAPSVTSQDPEKVTEEVVKEMTEEVTAEKEDLSETQSETKINEALVLEKEPPQEQSESEAVDCVENIMSPTSSNTKTPVKELLGSVDVMSVIGTTPFSVGKKPPETPFNTPAQSSEHHPVSSNVDKTAPTHPPPVPRVDREQLQEIEELQKKQQKMHQQAREAQKEARTLRRHMVSLNAQLERAETEMQAQRLELERAAERMEKDRQRHKENLEKEKAKHADQMKAAKAQQEDLLQSAKARAEQQLQEVKYQLNTLEERRMQEGGDLTKEMQNMVEKTRAAAKEIIGLKDENATLLSQVRTLQAQQEAMGNRLESLTQTADNAMERERTAEHRLDQVMSLHARQLTQRQTRESELERTIAELGAELVAVSARTKQATGVSNADTTANENQSPGDATGGEDSPEVRVQVLEHELDTVRGQLSHERQRNEALYNELRDYSKEHREEASVLQTRQLQHDRKVSDLNQTIVELKTELRKAEDARVRYSFTGNDTAGVSNHENVSQIKHLSEEVLRQRERLSRFSSEMSTLKTRLVAAVSRAEQAELALQLRQDEERGEWSDVELGGGMRRRGDKYQQRSRSNKSTPSMRSALHLDGSVGKSSQSIGKTLDALDDFADKSGKILRYSPFARLLFNFGHGTTVMHGPGALMAARSSPLLPPVAAAVPVTDGN